MEQVVLEYRRDPQKRVVGRVVYRPENGVEEEEQFCTEKFSHMLYLYADALKEHPRAEAMFHRTDRPNLPVSKLDPLTAEGLRERTEETVRQLDKPPPITVNLKVRLRGEGRVG